MTHIFSRFVSSDGLFPRVIESTRETLSFLLPYDTPEKWKRSREDVYNPFTPQGNVTNMKRKEKHAIILCNKMSVRNSSYFKLYIQTTSNFKVGSWKSGNIYKGSYTSGHFICNLLNEPLASLINFI